MKYCGDNFRSNVNYQQKVHFLRALCGKHELYLKTLMECPEARSICKVYQNTQL